MLMTSDRKSGVGGIVPLARVKGFWLNGIYETGAISKQKFKKCKLPSLTMSSESIRPVTTVNQISWWFEFCQKGH